MAMAERMQQYLNHAGVFYELIEHDPASTSREAAHKAHIPENQLAKAVVLKDHSGYLMAVVPADHQVSLDALRQKYGEALYLADEDALSRLFDDCETGAVPVLGEAYGVEVVWDERLGKCSDVFFEAGDHRDLVHVSGQDFQRLMETCEHGMICH